LDNKISLIVFQKLEKILPNLWKCLRMESPCRKIPPRVK
jgi:hypothetical protein